MQTGILKVTIVLVGVSACEKGSTPGPPVRLAADGFDTIIINSHRPKILPVHAFDADGRTIVGAPIRFAWVGGDVLPVTEAGTVTCSRSGDLDVRAVLDSLSTRVFVRCRLVGYIGIPGPIQFVLGDSVLSRPRELRIGVYSADRRPISIFTAQIVVPDSHVATVRGTTLNPRSRGSTVVSVYIGDREGTTGVHIYQRVEALEALDTLLRVHPRQRAFAVPLRLEPGTQYRQRLPPGHWMLALLPLEDHESTPIRMRVAGAACASNYLNDPGRLGCDAASAASVLVYRPLESREQAPAFAYLLIRWLSGPDPSRFVPRVAAGPASLPCVARFLKGRGYNVLESSHDTLVFRAERGEEGLGTPARREWIEVQLVSDSLATTLRGRAWAVDSYSAFTDGSRPQHTSVIEPMDATVADAREALQKCGH